MTNLSQADIEVIYERLALGIDEAGPERTPVFLAKVAMLMANEIGDPDLALRLIVDALQDLDQLNA